MKLQITVTVTEQEVRQLVVEYLRTQGVDAKPEDLEVQYTPDYDSPEFVGYALNAKRTEDGRLTKADPPPSPGS